MEKPEEKLPDIPVVLTLLESILQEIHEEDDLSKISKRQLALNQTNILDGLIALTKYVVAKGYALEILDESIAKKNTKEIESEEEPKEETKEKTEEEKEIDESVTKILDGMFT